MGAIDEMTRVFHELGIMVAGGPAIEMGEAGRLALAGMFARAEAGGRP